MACAPGRLSDYDFGFWDFHSVGYDRFSINFLCFFGANVTKFGPVPPDDEQYISANLAKKAGIREQPLPFHLPRRPG